MRLTFDAKCPWNGKPVPHHICIKKQSSEWTFELSNRIENTMAQNVQNHRENELLKSPAKTKRCSTQSEYIHWGSTFRNLITNVHVHSVFHATQYTPHTLTWYVLRTSLFFYLSRTNITATITTRINKQSSLLYASLQNVSFLFLSQQKLSLNRSSSACFVFKLYYKIQLA